MPKMSNRERAISMTRNDSWTTIEPKFKSEIVADFCLNHCPHSDDNCKGDCDEMKEFRKKHKLRGRKNG